MSHFLHSKILALLLALRRGGERDRDQFGAALHLEGGRAVDGQGGEEALDGRQVGFVHAVDRLAVHRHRDVAGPEPGLFPG